VDISYKKTLYTFVTSFVLFALLSTTVHARVQSVGISKKDAAKVVDKLGNLPKSKREPMKEAINNVLENPAVLELLKQDKGDPKRKKRKKRIYKPIGKYWE